MDFSTWWQNLMGWLLKYWDRLLALMFFELTGSECTEYNFRCLGFCSSLHTILAWAYGTRITETIFHHYHFGFSEWRQREGENLIIANILDWIILEWTLLAIIVLVRNKVGFQKWVNAYMCRHSASGQCLPMIMPRAFIAKDGLKTLFYHPPHPRSKYICLVCSVAHFRRKEWEVKFND